MQPPLSHVPAARPAPIPALERATQRLPVRLALTVASAALYAVAFPPLALRWCAWLALAPLLVALRRAPLGLAALLGALWGVCAAEGVGTWFTSGVASYYDRPLALGVGFFAGVALLLAAPFFAAFALAYAYGTRRRPLVSEALWVPMAWVACELARARFLVGNPWALLGYSQIGRPAILQIADTTGVYGVSFLLAAMSAAIVCLLDRGVRRGERLRAVALALLLVVAAALYGIRVLHQPTPQGTPLTVTVVQGNVDVGTQWRREIYGTNLETYLRLSQEALARDHAGLVVWPEAAVTFFLEDEPAYRAAIGHLLRSAGAHLITGGPAHAGERFFNGAFLLAPDGAILDRYDKVHLLPFAEYFPLAGIETLRRRFERVRVFAPGSTLRPLTGAPAPIAAVVCFEAMYPELVSSLVDQGAGLIVNLTNDAWMGRTAFARQHLAIASLRAVENRRYLVRAAATGISAVIDPFGRIVTEVPAFERGTTTARVHLLDGRTFYARYGDLFALACAAALVLVLASARARSPRP